MPSLVENGPVALEKTQLSMYFHYAAITCKGHGPSFDQT